MTDVPWYALGHRPQAGRAASQAPRGSSSPLCCISRPSRLILRHFHEAAGIRRLYLAEPQLVPLQAGARLGPYEILSLLGAGGMGEVYRARDTRLKRDVAVKVLPATFAGDPDRLARFQREAELLAVLNHPSIAAIYGLEEASGPKALILELVEGPTLADRLARGPLSLQEALAIGRQVVDALDAAHERGIVHRDLKPANIKVREDGAVKVLDFGLAKAFVGDSASGNASESPTMTARATMAGVIIGTAAYMSPEQARGRPVDKRSDVWAFGCVLYELLTGRRTFEADDVSATLAFVITKDPDWSLLAPGTPAPIRTLLRRCLEKDPRRRLADIADARLDIEDALAVPSNNVAAADESRGTSAARAGSAVWPRIVTHAVVAAAAGALGVWLSPRPAASSVTRTTIVPPASEAVTLNRVDRNVAITPDGGRVVYVGNNATQIFIRALDALDPVAIATSSGARGVFVSPDGRWVGFIENTTLKKVAITGGPSTLLTPIDGVGPRGATWTPDDTIIFATAATATGLQRIPAAGGTPMVLTRPDPNKGEADHLWPEILPGGRAVLFTISPLSGGAKADQVAVLDLQTGKYRVLIRGGGHAQYLASGHLVYVADGTLRAVRFDLNRLEVRGDGVTVAPRLVTTLSDGGNFAVAANGTLVYVDAPGGGAGTSILTWVDRLGKEDSSGAPPEGSAPRSSPDGTRVAVQKGGDIWLYDLRRTTFTRLTTDGGLAPIWTPDGTRVVFASGADGGVLNLWWQAADGGSQAERLTTSANVQAPTGISPDGTLLVFMEVSPSTGLDVMQLPLKGERRAVPLVQTKAAERDGMISPNGRWIAYESDGSGRFEVYVQPFPNVGKERWLVSTAGGALPLWAPNGRELFYFAPDRTVMRVPIDPTATSWTAGPSVKQFEPRYSGPPVGIPIRMYDIARDGQRLLVGKESSTPEAPTLVLVQHLDEELKRLAPTK